MIDAIFWWVGCFVVMTGGLALAGALVWWGMAAVVYYWAKLVIPVETFIDIVRAQQERNTERRRKRRHWLCTLGRHKWGATVAHGELEWECRRCGEIKPIGEEMEASDGDE